MEIKEIITDEFSDFEELLFNAGQKHPNSKFDNFSATHSDDDSRYCQVFVIYTGEYDKRIVDQKLKEEYGFIGEE